MDYVLESAIIIRIMDAFGIYTKDLPTIKTEQYRHPKFPNLWSARVNLYENTHISANLCEKNKNYYLTIKFTDRDEDQPIIYCLECGDMCIQEDCGNYISLYDSSNKEDDFVLREPAPLIIANLFKGFEEIREYVPHWLPYEATQEDLKIIHKFVKSRTNEI